SRARQSPHPERPSGGGVWPALGKRRTHRIGNSGGNGGTRPPGNASFFTEILVVSRNWKPVNSGSIIVRSDVNFRSPLRGNIHRRFVCFSDYTKVVSVHTGDDGNPFADVRFHHKHAWAATVRQDCIAHQKMRAVTPTEIDTRETE